MSEATEVADRSNLSAKQLWISAAWLIGGMVLGQFIERIVDPVWSKLTLVPFGHWLDAHKTKDNHALLMSLVALWLVAPEWGLVAAVAAFRGMFTREHLIPHLLLFGIGFAFFPVALHFCLYFAFPDLQTIGWETSSVGLAIFVGLLTHRLAHRKIKNQPQEDVLER